jgi:hypothetical protein
MSFQCNYAIGKVRSGRPSHANQIATLLSEFLIKTRREKRAFWYWLWAISIICFVSAAAVPHGRFFVQEVLAGLIGAVSGTAGLFFLKRKGRRRKYGR